MSIIYAPFNFSLVKLIVGKVVQIYRVCINGIYLFIYLSATANASTKDKL